ncbi:TPA: hypothetical protein ACXDAY_002083 [Clostridium botulinum]|uniref:hypothetical protein n=1 Tax=Clostridium botulinum TaxID=1491 RepID=UPI0004659E39|nr:hypothetical protein [Clostridium botulinum]APR02577.1 toxin-antitoxin system, toxin component, RelE family [Clostridium botulinum]AUN01614.1 hypothetical protein RSJ19_01150 [Clostridium botulinum]MBN3359334.1 hypothetical protein [Clostridium botulinum]MBN3367163.1 hypothetical protein [Clostridium botulinum]MBN3375680.1 hypothetical protein [Clostridium botulinum]
MNYEIYLTPKFEEDIKFYKKKRKFCKIEKDIDVVIEEIEKGNLVGDAIDDIHLPEGEDTYKARASNTDTKVGKANGYRIIYYVIKDEKTIFLLTIYYKKDDNRILNKKEIIDLINKCYDD